MTDLPTPESVENQGKLSTFQALPNIASESPVTPTKSVFGHRSDLTEGYLSLLTVLNELSNVYDRLPTVVRSNLRIDRTEENL